MISVVEVISDINIGGAGRLLVNKIKYSDKRKFKYFVVLPKGSLLIPYLKKVGACIVQIDGCENKSFDIRGIFILYKIIKTLSPDILNSHACISARIAGRLAKVRVNLYTRHCDFPTKKVFEFSWVRRAFGVIDDFLNDGVIAVSDSAKRNLLMLGVKEQNIKVIINGADGIDRLSPEKKKKIRAELEIPADATVVSIFARLEKYKDHKTFLRAAHFLNSQLNNIFEIYFLIVGTGSIQNDLKKYAKNLNLDSNVRFLGFVDDVTEIMNVTDINVNCSIGTETSSLALSEGMSIGIPSVVSDYLGNKYMVRDNVNGLIFPQRDFIGLVKGILRLCEDKSLYDKLSKQSKERFEKELNAARMTEETEKYYLSMLKGKGLKGITNLS